MSNISISKKIDFLINFVYGTIIILLLFLLVKYSFGFIYPFVFALFTGVIIEPFIVAMQTKVKLNRTISAIICIIVYYLVVLVCIVLIILVLYSTLRVFVQEAPSAIEALNKYIDSIKDKQLNLTDRITLELFSHLKSLKPETLIGGNFGTNILEYIARLMKSLPQFAIGLIVSVVASFFIAVSFCEIKNFILMQFSEKHRKLIVSSKHIICN